jgi:hypothetical protein
MAAQVACALSFLGAGASVAHGANESPVTAAGSATSNDSALERTADVLRLRPSSGGCVPSWGPPAPPEADALFARFLELEEVAS